MSAVHDFCHRLEARDPRAINTLRKLGAMHYAGNRDATRALHQIAACRMSIRSGRMHSGAAPLHLVTKPLSWLTKTVGKVLSTTGNLTEHAGKFAAKPFHWAGTKLQNVATHGVHLHMPRMLASHTHVP